MTILHVVLFEPKQGADESFMNDLCIGMGSLATKCIHPTTQQPYIKSLTGGKNNSTEPFKAPYTYGFTVEFEKTEDRDYYTQKDPAHAEFVKSVKENLSGIAVFDYEPGKF